MVLLSGGIDSATCLHLAAKNRRVTALTFEYHGIARSELAAAKELGKVAVDHRFVRLPDLKEAGDISAAKFKGMPSTYIPMRNAIFYAFAASVAEEIGASEMIGGHNHDDRATFQDARAQFFDKLEGAILQGSSRLRRQKLSIVRPLETMPKFEVVRLAASVGVPLGSTWSCHRAGRSHCWECEGCLSRKKAFLHAGIKDPLLEGAGKVS